MTSQETRIKEVLGDEKFKLIKKLSETQESVMTYEFKSLAAGGDEVMAEIPRLSELPIFEWTVCNNRSKTKHRRQLENVANVVKGPDAERTPWNLDRSPTSPSNAETVQPQPPTGSSSVQGFSKAGKVMKRRTKPGQVRCYPL